MTTAAATRPGNGSANAVQNAMQTATNGEKVMQFVPFGADSAIKLTVAIVKTICTNPTKSGKLPTDEDCFRFMMLCQARKLNPFEGDAYLVGYDGKDGPVFSLITAHQAFLKRAESHPQYDGMESGVVVADANGEAVDREGDFLYENELVLGGWARVYFKNRKIPMYRRLSLAARYRDTKTWKEDPGGMVCKCAEGDALRSSFPTLLGGLYAAEEMQEPVVMLPAPGPAPIVPTPGRQKVSSSRRPASTAPAQVQQQEPVNEEADDAPADFSEEAEQLKLALRDGIDAAETKAELTKVGSKLKEGLAVIGEDAHKELLTYWQERFRQLSAK